jgi:hypothetical protein
MTNKIHCPACGQALNISQMPVNDSGNVNGRCSKCLTGLRFGVGRRNKDFLDIRVFKERGEDGNVRSNN